MLMQEYEQAIKAYKQAESNFNNATFEDMDSAILFLNATQKRVDELHSKIRKAYGVKESIFARQHIERNERQADKKYENRKEQENLAKEFFRKYLGGGLSEVACRR